MTACRLPLLLFVSISVVAAGVPAGKAPWEWTIEERLTKRFDPESIKERRSPEVLRAIGFHIDNDSARGHGGGIQSNAKRTARENIVAGSRNPELLLPWELFNHLMSTTSAPQEDARNYNRRRYTRLGSAVVPVPDDFWTRLDAITVDYRALLAEQWTNVALLSNADPADDTAARDQLATLDARICIARAAALRRAREEFGAEWLAKFLYAAVPPGLFITGIEETPDQHREMERGCR